MANNRFSSKSVFQAFIFGFAASGKNSLANVLESAGPSPLSPQGLSLQLLFLPWKGSKIKFLLYVVAGTPSFSQLPSVAFQRSAGGLLVFDLTNVHSFERLSGYLDLLHKYCKDKPVILVGNKKDLTRVVPQELAQAFASKHGLPYFETSAKTGENVVAVFTRLAELILNAGIKPGD